MTPNTDSLCSILYKSEREANLFRAQFSKTHHVVSGNILWFAPRQLTECMAGLYMVVCISKAQQTHDLCWRKHATPYTPLPWWVGPRALQPSPAANTSTKSWKECTGTGVWKKNCSSVRKAAATGVFFYFLGGGRRGICRKNLWALEEKKYISTTAVVATAWLGHMLSTCCLSWLGVQFYSICTVHLVFVGHNASCPAPFMHWWNRLWSLLTEIKNSVLFTSPDRKIHTMANNGSGAYCMEKRSGAASRRPRQPPNQWLNNVRSWSLARFQPWHFVPASEHFN